MQRHSGCYVTVLFEKPFFEKIHKALKPGGVVCTQGECVWLHVELIKDVLEMCKGIFVGGSVQYGFTTIPTYPSGQIGFVMCSKPDEEGKTVNFTKPNRPPPVAPGESFFCWRICLFLFCASLLSCLFLFPPLPTFFFFLSSFVPSRARCKGGKGRRSVQ